ncbi:hypothetical protein [Streptomyces sp. NBC_00829]|uniref:hypothetical protein n=1 Tax=Streptomyces sp. NBC_00829 TaxID=2903679 RepID=UPI00386C0270|nr:hypothetical protein OG293_38425 [Streptomyces sp. NBC_00829]
MAQAGHGVGETRACGTGACAAVAAAVQRHGIPSAAASYTVDVPGGQLRVDRIADGSMELTGPAQIVAQGTTVLASSAASAGAATVH